MHVLDETAPPSQNTLNGVEIRSVVVDIAGFLGVNEITLTIQAFIHRHQNYTITIDMADGEKLDVRDNRKGFAEHFRCLGFAADAQDEI